MVSCMSAEALAQAQSVTYRYDSLGRVVQVTYSNGASVTYAYDAAGNRTQQASSPKTPAPTVGNVAANVAYNTATAVALTPLGAYTGLAVVGSPTKGSVSISGTTATYTPTNGTYGADSFTYKAVGPGGESVPGTVSITVATPAAPTVAAVSASTAYNTPATFNLAPSGVYASLSKASDPAHGSVVVSGTTATYTPANGYYGADSFTYTATGPGGTSAPATASLTVGLPAAPGAAAVSTSTGYNTAKSIALSPSGVYSSLAVVASPTKGSVSISGTTATYTPNTSAYGADSFTYKAVGPGGESAPASVGVTIANPPAPSAADIGVSVGYNSGANIFFPGGGDWVSLNLVSQPSRGNLGAWTWANGGWNIPYTPNAGVYGADSFVYNITNPGGSSGNRTVTLNVATPPAPGAGDASLSVGYNSTASLNLPVSGVATGAALDAAPAKGTVSFSGTTATYKVTWPNYGADSFTYHATGPGGSSAVRTVNVSIGNPPIPSSNNGSASTAYNTAVAVTYPVTGDYAEVALDSNPAHGTISPPGHVAGVGHQSTYTPHPGYYGPDSWTFHGYNAGGSSPVRTFSINVGLPPAPSAAATSLSILSLTSGSVQLQPGGVYSGVAISAQPAHGSVSLNGTTATYTPSGAYVGNDSFSYVASGPGGSSTPGTVSVTVQNRAPTPQNDAVSTFQNQAVTFDPRGNDSDPEGHPLSVYTAWGTPNGTAQANGSSVTYTPGAGFVGTDTFYYGVMDGYGGTGTATVTVNVQPTPVFSAGVSTPSWFAQRYGTAPIAKDPAVTVTTANGVGPYTYAWERVSGDTSTTVDPSGATATWSRTLSTYGQWTSVWRCKVTDGAGRVAYTSAVSVTFQRETAS